jgi:hypothetical protein
MTIESLEDLKKQKQAESPATSYALETAYNIPSSTAKFVRDTIEPILSPIDTAKSVIELGKGIYNLSTPGEQPSEATARAVGKYFYDRYGGENLNQVKANISKTLKEDPIGFFADLAVPLTVTRAPLKADSIVSKVTKAIDPTEALIKGTKGAYQFVAKPSFSKLGSLIRGQAGLGDGVLQTAYKSGRVGGDPLRYLREQMSKDADLNTKLKPIYNYIEGLENISKARRKSYLEGMSKLGLDAIKIDPLKVRQSVIGVTGDFTRGGKAATPKLRKKIEEVNNLVDEFIANPSLHTVDGLDFLKQSLNDLKPDVTARDRTSAYVTGLQNKFKKDILEKSPEYAGVMDAYSESALLQNQIQKALGKNDLTAIETIGRKLQASTRDNVATSYGLRTKLVEELAEEGKQPMLPYQLAGQALEPMLPRGISRAITGAVGTAAAGGGLYFQEPGLLALAATQTAASSPRLLGEAAIKAGQFGGKISPSMQKLYELYPNLDPYLVPSLKTTRFVGATPISEAQEISGKEEFLQKFPLNIPPE